VEPARVLAVLFADVSGSTSLYETLGDRAALAAVESVLSLLKRAVATQQGRVVKTIGTASGARIIQRWFFRLSSAVAMTSTPG
jgi:class 3 adenylate cyclase